MYRHTGTQNIFLLPPGLVYWVRSLHSQYVGVLLKLLLKVRDNRFPLVGRSAVVEPNPSVNHCQPVEWRGAVSHHSWVDNVTPHLQERKPVGVVTRLTGDTNQGHPLILATYKHMTLPQFEVAAAAFELTETLLLFLSGQGVIQIVRWERRSSLSQTCPIHQQRNLSCRAHPSSSALRSRCPSPTQHKGEGQLASALPNNQFSPTESSILILIKCVATSTHVHTYD